MPSLRTNRRVVNYQVPDENDQTILLGGNKDWIRYHPRKGSGGHSPDEEEDDYSSKHSKSSSSSASKSNQEPQLRRSRNPLQMIQRRSKSPPEAKANQRRQGRSRKSSPESTPDSDDVEEEEELASSRTVTTKITTTTRHRSSKCSKPSSSSSSRPSQKQKNDKKTTTTNTRRDIHINNDDSSSFMWTVGTRCAVEYVEDHAYLNSQRPNNNNGRGGCRGNLSRNKKQNPVHQTNRTTTTMKQTFLVAAAAAAAPLPAESSSFTYWHPGTIFKVESNRVWVRFDDQSTELIPKQDVRILIPSSSTTTWYFASAADSAGGCGDIFGQCPPRQPLEVGDLVQVHFQNGRYCPDAYYVGRVAAINHHHNDIPVVSVAYQDGDYEENIPYPAITVLQKGIEHPQFLLGLTGSCRNGGSSSRRGVIVRADPYQPVHIQFPGDDKATTSNTIVQRSYHDVVTALFQAARETLQPTVCQWPTELEETDNKRIAQKRFSSSSSSSKRSRRQSSSQCSNKRVQRSSKTPSTSSEYKEADDEFKSDDDENNRDHDVLYEEEEQEEESPQPFTAKRSARKTSTRLTRAAANSDVASVETNQVIVPKKRRSRIKSRSMMATTTSTEPDENTAVLEESFYHTVSHFLEAEEPPQMSPRPFQPMYPAFSNIFGKALNSADCHVGLQMLTFLFTMHDQVPNDDLWNQLIDLITYGPKSGSAYFPDTAKMIAVMQYLRLMFSLHGQLDRCCEIVDRESFLAKHGGMAYPELVLSHLSPTYRFYMAEGDEYRTNRWAVGRIEQSLHVRNCLAEVFLHLVKHQLQPYVRRERTGEKSAYDHDEEDDSHAYRDRPIIRHIVHARRGAKDALEKAVVAGIQHWLSYGHFVTVSGESRFYADANPPSLDSLDSVCGRVISLAEQQGLIISCLAWLYGKEANEDSFALADLIAQILDREMTAWATPSAIANRFEYLREIKLQFIGHLEPSLCPQLRPKLAERLDVFILYNIIYAP